MNRTELEKHLGEYVDIKIFDGSVYRGTLRKTGTEEAKNNPNLYLKSNYYFLAHKGTYITNSCLFRVSHIRSLSKNHRTGEFTGRFSKHAQPDFQGTLYGGRSIVFEAKKTTKDRITRNVLTDTQMDVLEKHSRLGALCGVCICIQDDFFFIPWNVWRDMKEMYGRQYLKPDDIEEYKVKFDGAVHFLMHTEELKGAYENAERKR